MIISDLTVENSFFLQYRDACKRGNILIGSELMTALDMYFEDLSNPKYRYNTAEAHKRIRFIENECKHSISPFAGKPFILELWEKAFEEVEYSFQMQIDGKWVRRFTEALLLIGRKNGKTSFCAADSNAEFFCGNVGTHILCASNDYEQAGLIFDEINNMRESSPKLARVSRKNQKGIFMGNPKRKNVKGKFSYQNKAEIKKLSAKTGAKEGKNVDKAIVDEVHEMKDNSLILPIRQSMSTKDEYLITEITTEGFTDEGYLDNRLWDARAVLKGELDRPRWLIWMYTQDSEEEIWQNRDSWVKSNPNLGVSKKWSFLDDLIEEAKINSATRAFLLAKDFNIKQSTALSWLQASEILNTAIFDLNDFRGSYYIAGNDFAETTDLCSSKILLKRAGENTKYLYSHYWIPREKLKYTPDNVDYEEWAKQGFLTIVDEPQVDSALVADWQYQLYKDYGLEPYKSGYDNRFARSYIQRFEEIFGEGMLLNVPQDAKCLSNPMRALESDLRVRRHNYNNNPIDFWCFRNTGFKLDNLGRIMPMKIKKTKRIDGTAAALCCYAVYEWYANEFNYILKG